MAESSNHSFDSSTFMNIFNSPEHDIWSNNSFIINHNNNKKNSDKHNSASHRPFSSTQQVKGNIFNLPTQHRHSINAPVSGGVSSVFNSSSSISAPSSSAQRRSTSHLPGNYGNSQKLSTKSTNNPVSTSSMSTTQTIGSDPLTCSTNPSSNSTSKPQSSPTVWPYYSNTSLEDVTSLNPNTSARSSRFFPSPYESNRTFDLELNNPNILNNSPLLDHRRSTLPNFETSSPFHNNSNTPTPQYDSPNANYFSYLPPTGSTKNLTYSTIFGDVNNSNSSTMSNQYSNFSSTPIQNKHHSRMERNTSYPNIDYSFVNFNPLNINNQPNLQLNPLLRQSSSFVDGNDEDEMADDSIYGFKTEASKVKVNSNDLLVTTDFSELSFIDSKNSNNVSPIHSPSPSNIFYPQLNLKNIHQSSPIKDKNLPEPSPHTPLNQQDLLKLLQIDTNDTQNVLSTNIESPISASSSNFPSPTLPSIELFQPSNSQSPPIETKPRVLHYINSMITRHNVIYRSYVVSVPRHTPIKKSVYLLENILYSFGTVKDIEILKSNNEEFTKMRVITVTAESQLTNVSSANYTHNLSNREKEEIDVENDTNGLWKSVKFKLGNNEVKLLIFFESENTNYTKLNRTGVIKVLLKRDDIESIIENSKNSMSRALTLNNKLDVCWYPEGFSSTFHRRGVNNFMFVRELQSKMIVNRTRVSGGGIVEMGEFRISMPIEEMGFTNDKLSSEKLKRSFLVNIDLKELDGKSDLDNKKEKTEPKEYSSSPNSSRGKFKKRGGFSRGRGRGGR